MKAKLRTIIRAARAGVSGSGQVGATYLPPVWSSSTPASVNWPAGNPVSYSFSQFASSPIGRALTFSATGLPPGLSMSAAGAVTGTPQGSVTNLYAMTLRASDGTSFTDRVVNAQIPTTALWTDGLGDVFPFTEGQAFSFTLEATDPDVGDPIDFVLGSVPAGIAATPQAQAGTTRQLTISSAGMAAGTYIVGVDLAEPSAVTALADWSLRAGGPGVLWAHRFNDNSAMYWAKVLGDGVHRPDLSIRQSTGGIIGDGYLRLFAPANVVTTGGFARPLAPVVGATPAGAWSGLPYPSDVNVAGRPTMDFNAFYSSVPGDPQGKIGNMVGGFFTHADYQNYTLPGNELWNPALRPNQIKSSDGTHFTGTDFYLQFRIRVPPLYLSTFNSKFLMIINGGNGTPYHEIVSNFVPTIGSIFYFYTSQGNQPNSTLWDPQGSSSAGTKLEPGADAPYGTQCVVPAGVSGRPALPLTGQCWAWPANEWVTVLVHVIPGHHDPMAHANPANTWTQKDTGIEAWVATQTQIDAARNAGQTPQYTKIWDKKDYAFDYFGRYQFADINGSTISPNGWNLVNLTMFLNYSSSSAQSWPEDLWRDIDQVICSTQFIPCPRY